ncbi:L-iditol 2-dehydrogenase [Saccharomonospora piscinae]|uniref:L-iditol 2-dehydrogenase n=1 Tax=Saccharomonospora piscinae TaxID=687388 RepID=A0A1V9AD66_SACPI|nr:alcohol dehydrogenase catalytic domain-containing protein [Saccharomonospora piscinae]OQO95065.1 L-iditol 2-dehydrogenase [Saccharomonospora piscinae]TLW90459.1 zinc-binding dehydrogenase [Saccharomonospora piscinae]
MRAIVLTRPRRVEVVDDWPEPAVAEGEVLVGMRAVGLCGSDLSVHDGDRETPHLPWVMGHEGGGTILAVGDGVSDRYPGQRVVIEPNYGCLRCPQCRSGSTSACASRGIVGMNLPGLLAERVAVPARYAWPVPATTPDSTLACVEPLAVARAAVRRAAVGAGDDCLVLGAGSQGLLVCQALLAVGARPSVVEPLEGRVALAERLGAHGVEAGRARDFPVVFDTVGAPATWEVALRAVASTGSVVVIGMSAEPAQLSTVDLVRRQVVIRGSLIYDHPADFGDTVAAVTADPRAPARVLQHAARPDQAAEAFAQARSVAGKSWIDLGVWQEDDDG